MNRVFKTPPQSEAGDRLTHLHKEAKFIFIAFVRVWALDIYAGNDESGFEHNSTYAIFNIRIHLTDEGFDHLREVILVIFQYIHLLQREGPVYKIFSEIQKMEQIDFDYAEERSTQNNVQDLSEAMQLYKSEHILTGGSLLYKYDPDVSLIYS